MNQPDPLIAERRSSRPRSLRLGVWVVGLALVGAARLRGQDFITTQPLADLRRAVAVGNPAACLQLGMRYEMGVGVKRDYAQARALYGTAAAGGVASAIYRLGHLDQMGLGAIADPAKAYQLYRMAALANVPLAQYNLGAMLVSGRDVDPNFVEGLAWLILARRNKVDADGEAKVRARLADQPLVVAAAEKRADALAAEIALRRGTKPPWPPPDEDSLVPRATLLRPTPALPTLPPPRAEPPKFEPPPLPPPGMSAPGNP